MSYTAGEIFGIGGAELAELDKADPQTAPVRAYASTETATLQPASPATRAILDPKGSAIFWIAAAALLGLVMVTGQFKVQAALGGRAGRGR